MTNRQSNIIFYSVISLIIYALFIHYAYPDFFENFTKSKEELSIKDAINNGEHAIALSMYQQLVKTKLNDNGSGENNAEVAVIYEEMANLHSLLGNKNDEKDYYLKSVNLKEQLKKTEIIGIVTLYDKLGSLAEKDKQYDEAQMYYEKSLSKKLGSNVDKDDGLFVGMQHTREQYLRLNNEMTIDTFKKLAEIHDIKREYDISKTYYEKALKASKLTFGEDHVKTLELMNLMNRLAL